MLTVSAWSNIPSVPSAPSEPKSKNLPRRLEQRTRAAPITDHRAEKNAAVMASRGVDHGSASLIHASAQGRIRLHVRRAKISPFNLYRCTHRSEHNRSNSAVGPYAEHVGEALQSR